jgi:nucleoside 2-deoxyribosyltransferase
MKKAKTVIKLGQQRNTCFAIMPFSAKMDSLYKKVLKKAAKECDLEPKRADEVYGSRAIMSDIWSAMRSARVVIAELTGKNPNVLYELGLAHAAGKPVIIVTADINDVPFDLKHIRCIVYDKDKPDWGERLEKDIIKTIRQVLKGKSIKAVLEDISVK